MAGVNTNYREQITIFFILICIISYFVGSIYESYLKPPTKLTLSEEVDKTFKKNDLYEESSVSTTFNFNHDDNKLEVINEIAKSQKNNQENLQKRKKESIQKSKKESIKNSEKLRSNSKPKGMMK